MRDSALGSAQGWEAGIWRRRKDDTIQRKASATVTPHKFQVSHANEWNAFVSFQAGYHQDCLGLAQTSITVWLGCELEQIGA
jgi:hypothetical protein